MSRRGLITFEWADGTYTFRLAIGQLLELQEATDAGPAELLGRISSGKWRVKDLLETIRLGLIGGGTTPSEARSLVQRYVLDRPLLESVMPAKGILMAAIIGTDEERVGKDAAPTAATETASSGSPPSSAPAP